MRGCENINREHESSVLRGDGPSRGGGRDLIPVVLNEYRSGASLEVLGAASKGRPHHIIEIGIHIGLMHNLFTTQTIAHLLNPYDDS